MCNFVSFIAQVASKWFVCQSCFW